MDIKAEIEKLAEKIKKNPELLASFKTDPIKAVEGLLGIDLPDETIKSIVAGIKAKLGADDAKDMLDDAKGLLGKVKKLF